CGSLLCFFFFQAEDGIRDWSVTGVQTCALPIWSGAAPPPCPPASVPTQNGSGIWAEVNRSSPCATRARRSAARLTAACASGGRGSGERRGGEEGRARGGPRRGKKEEGGSGAEEG